MVPAQHYSMLQPVPISTGLFHLPMVEIIFIFARPNSSFKKQVTVTTRRVPIVKIVPIELPPSKFCVFPSALFFLLQLYVFVLTLFQIVNTVFVMWLCSLRRSVPFDEKDFNIFIFKIISVFWRVETMETHHAHWLTTERRAVFSKKL